MYPTGFQIYPAAVRAKKSVSMEAAGTFVSNWIRHVFYILRVDYDTTSARRPI